MKGGFEQRRAINDWEHHRKEMAKINCIADKYQKQSRRERVLFNLFAHFPKPTNLWFVEHAEQVEEFKEIVHA